MKSVSHPKYFLLALLALGLAFLPVVRAQEAAPPAPPPPDVAVAPAEPVQPTPPVADASAEAKAEDKPALAAPEAPAAEVKPEESTIEQEPVVEKATESRGHRRSRHNGNERVSFGSSSTLAQGESAAAVISIIGSSTSFGEVDDAVVSILGGSRVEGGTVGGAVVSVLGNTYVNGEVRGEVVTVFGNVELGPKAVINGEVVCIGGQLTRDAKAVVKGNIQNIAVAGRHFDFSSLTAWFTECLLYGRPLAFDSRLIWAWTLALGLLGFYALIALIAPAGVMKCVETLEQRPGSSLLAALLTMLLTPVAFILLALTLFIAIGFVLIPLLSLGLFFAALFGKIVMLAWLGRRITRLLGDGPLAHPVFGVLIGGMIVLGLYTIPIVGFITYKLVGILGLGVVVFTLINKLNASRPPKPSRSAVPRVGVAAAGMVTPTADAGGEVPPTDAPLLSAAPPVISAATLTRVGFWHRLGASLLDCILLGIVTGISSSVLHGWLTPGGSLPFWFAVYCVVMWATKGTTIGGIICGLKVVRMDDRPLDWSVAVVRALGGFLSLAVAGLGFIWVAFDDEKQSWHDKIAGTTIVKVPKGTSLV